MPGCGGDAAPPTSGRSRTRACPRWSLMETAGRAVAEAAAQVASSSSAAIVCGKGNNGGDGLVAARALRETGFQVDALLLAPPDELSDDSRANVDRFDGARQVDPGELADGDAGHRGGDRRRLRHRLRGRAPRPRGLRDRGDEPGGGARGGHRHRVRRQRLHGRGGGGGRRRRRHGDLPRAEARPLDRAGQGAHGRAPGRADRDSGRRAGAAQGGSDQSQGARAGAEPCGRVDQVQLGTGA